MRNLLDRKVLFFGGKGGVGKTTCAAAMSLAASRAGKRVLIVSTDPAHSLSDVFEVPLGDEEREIAPSLIGLEIDSELEARRYLREVKERISTMFNPGVVHEAFQQVDLVAGMPGLADVALFDRMTDLLLSRIDAYDLVVFDTAPTGHTLRLLQMPEALAAWVRALSERRRKSLEQRDQAGLASTVGAELASPERDIGHESSRRARPPEASGEGSDDDPILDALTTRQARLASVRDLLTRYQTTAFVLVLIPERLPIEESARAVHELEHAHLHVGGAIINRVLPEHLSGDYYAARKAQEKVYLEEIDKRFRAVPRVLVPQLESDVHGIGSLARMAGMLAG